MLFEVECEHYHFGSGFGERLCELVFLRVIDQIRTVVGKHVAETEAEFYFGIELEIGQIEIAAESYAEIYVAGFELQYVAAFLGHIESRHHAGSNIGARITVAHTAEFYVDGKYDERRFYILALACVGVYFLHCDVAASEVHAGRQTDGEVVVEA